MIHNIMFHTEHKAQALAFECLKWREMAKNENNPWQVPVHEVKL